MKNSLAPILANPLLPNLKPCLSLLPIFSQTQKD